MLFLQVYGMYFTNGKLVNTADRKAMLSWCVLLLYLQRVTVHAGQTSKYLMASIWMKSHIFSFLDRA